MTSWKKCMAILFVILGASRLVAGTMTPYQTVLVDWQQDSLLIVDMETGTHTEIPIEAPSITGSPSAVAVDNSNGAIYVYYWFFLDASAPVDPFVGSLVARLDPTLSEWTTMRIGGLETQGAGDMEFRPDGNLIVAAEFDVYDIDLAAKTVRLSGVKRTGDLIDGGTIGVEIDSSGTIVTGGGAQVGNLGATPIFRQTAEAEFAERLDPGVFLSDFVLDSDGSLIGVVRQDGLHQPLDTGMLYRLNFDTKAVDFLFESDLLIGARRMELDPDGRLVVLTGRTTPSSQIVRVDLEIGTAELIADLGMRELSTMNLRIIPEPSSAALLVLGSLALFVCFRNRVKSYC